MSILLVFGLPAAAALIIGAAALTTLMWRYRQNRYLAFRPSKPALLQPPSQIRVIPAFPRLPFPVLPHTSE